MDSVDDSSSTSCFSITRIAGTQLPAVGLRASQGKDKILPFWSIESSGDEDIDIGLSEES